MSSLIARHGGEPTVAPSLREVPLEENTAAFEFGRRLLEGRIDSILFLTGVGAQALLDSLKLRHDEAAVLAAIDRLLVAVRGPKPTAVLKKWNVHIDVKAPEPNTWRETVVAIRNAIDLGGKTIAVQEYGKPNAALYAELETSGATVLPVPVYRWDLPLDREPLENTIRSAISDAFDIFAFTSAQQVENVLSVASDQGIERDLKSAMLRSVIVSIGPTCTEALREHALPPDIEASPPKMGPMVRTALEQAPSILLRKKNAGGVA
jgi:uroporphyrinogen-III synthase